MWQNACAGVCLSLRGTAPTGPGGEAGDEFATTRDGVAVPLVGGRECTAGGLGKGGRGHVEGARWAHGSVDVTTLGKPVRGGAREGSCRVIGRARVVFNGASQGLKRIRRERLL